jgi:glycogen operon protein
LDATSRGTPHPLGASFCADGVNFSVFSKSAESLELLLFDHVDDDRPVRVIKLDPGQNRTHHYWHVCVAGLGKGQLYAYRASGPNDPARRLRFDGEKLLLDPYARGVATGPGYDRAAAARPGANAGKAMKSVVAKPGDYDWEGDRPLERPYSETVIYEMHVGGFTRHPSSGLSAELRGTYRGVIEKIPYLQELGITAVELLPVFQFDEQDCPAGLSNYWGYSPVSFFAPHAGYSIDREPLEAIDEFRDMVKALHRAGIEVILDVVYNHTAEGDEGGPTFCFRGLQDDVYYLFEEHADGYSNFSGTGNALNANHAVVRRMIRDSLRYWVQEMHVDGFRFDLASVMSRDEMGRPTHSPPVLWAIDSDPQLAGAKIIAEAWDAGGLYQVGQFIGDRWTEWNGKFRDDVRRYVRGDRGMMRLLPTRMLGSPDLYSHEDREPGQSINFVTCHDGFTLNDLVSYDRKHNGENLEGNRDGTDENYSWNCGSEGPTDDARIEALRNRQVKNFLTLLMLSMGTPMMLMGDEVRNTQHGNNNVYCQDNEVSWFDWTLLDSHADILRFVRLLIQYRLHLDMSMTRDRVSLNELLAGTDIQFHGVRLNDPDWADHSHALAATFVGVNRTREMHVMGNAFREPLEFELPPASHDGVPWRLLIDTSLNPPHDIHDPHAAPEVSASYYRVEPYTIVLLGRSLAKSAGFEADSAPS